MRVQAAVTSVRLVCDSARLPRPGQEVTIDYGSKSNEELLFLYGFALQDNPHEVGACRSAARGAGA